MGFFVYCVKSAEDPLPKAFLWKKKYVRRTLQGSPGGPLEKSNLPDAGRDFCFSGLKNANIIKSAISKLGPDHDNIRDSFADLKYKEGVTGVIYFDDMGNRIGTVGLVEIHNGHPVAVGND